MKIAGDSEEAIEEDLAEAKHDVLQHVTSAVAESVEVGNIGAVSTCEHEHAPDGYCLLEFTSLPYPEEDGLKVDGVWLNAVQHARKWFTFSEQKTTVNVVNMVETNVVANPMSAGNMLPKRIKDQLHDASLAVKISEESHNTILDEILSREALEYDPSRVVVGEVEEDELEEE